MKTLALSSKIWILTIPLKFQMESIAIKEIRIHLNCLANNHEGHSNPWTWRCFVTKNHGGHGVEHKVHGTERGKMFVRETLFPSCAFVVKKFLESHGVPFTPSGQ
jgi:hypothetical protein